MKKIYNGEKFICVRNVEKILYYGEICKNMDWIK